MGRAAALIAIVALTFFAVASLPAAAEEVIERYASDVVVARDGTLTVSETIRVRAEGDQIKRGIYRDFPITFEDEDGTVREVGFRLINVTRDGSDEPHFTEREGESIRIYAGEESVFLDTGTHTYVITYETDRQLRWFDGRPELYWNVTGNGWAFPIQGATVRVTLPDRAVPVRWTAYTGPFGAQGTDFSGAVGSDGTLAVQTTRRLEPREGFTVAVEIPAEAVDEPSAATEAGYFLRDHRGWVIGFIGFAGVFAYYAWAWNAVGRDPKPGTIIPLFRPPEGVSPALASYIHRWGFGGNAWRAFTAAALSLAVRGLVTFEQPKTKELTLERTAAEPPRGVDALPPGERAILDWVHGEGGRAEINRANGKAVAEIGQAFRKSITAENDQKFFRRNTLYFIGGVALTGAVFAAIAAFGGLQAHALAVVFPIGFMGVVLGTFVVPLLRALHVAKSSGSIVRAALGVIPAFGFLAFFGAQFLSDFGSDSGSGGGILSMIFGAIADHPFPVALVIMFPALNGLYFYLLRAPTTLGRPVMDQLEGLRLYLETAESGRLNIADAPEITTERFEALLPYAVALEVEKPWADAFAAALQRAHPGDSDPMRHYHPRWSRGYAWSGGNFGRSMAAAVGGATGALAASLPRASSGSSGFSGGGSGGGGGGGGGGGW